VKDQSSTLLFSRNTSAVVLAERNNSNIKPRGVEESCCWIAGPDPPDSCTLQQIHWSREPHPRLPATGRLLRKKRSGRGPKREK